MVKLWSEDRLAPFTKRKCSRRLACGGFLGAFWALSDSGGGLRASRVGQRTRRQMPRDLRWSSDLIGEPMWD
jgi:hypothetical protein